MPEQPTPPTQRPSPTPPPITIPPPGYSCINLNKRCLGERPKEIVPNRIRGKSRIICEENGVEFGFRPLFPFTGKNVLITFLKSCNQKNTK